MPIIRARPPLVSQARLLRTPLAPEEEGCDIALRQLGFPPGRASASVGASPWHFCSLRHGPLHPPAGCRRGIDSPSPLRDLAAARPLDPFPPRTEGTAAVGPAGPGPHTNYASILLERVPVLLALRKVRREVQQLPQLPVIFVALAGDESSPPKTMLAHCGRASVNLRSAPSTFLSAAAPRAHSARRGTFRT